MPIAHNLGFPHLGAARELKRATEGYWGGKVSLPDLLKTGAELRARHWRLQQDAGIDLIPSNDFAHYDRALETCPPVLIGPVTFLLLGKARTARFDRLTLLDALLPVYAEVLSRLAAAGATWVQLDEPCLALDRTPAERAAFVRAYRFLAERVPKLKILVATYFAGLDDNLPTALELPVAGLHVDAVRAAGRFEALLQAWPAGGGREGKVLSLGVIDGRNIWKADLSAVLRQLEDALERAGAAQLWVAPSCSLLHVPIDLDLETRLDSELKAWLAFAKQKLVEVATLARALREGRDSVTAQLDANTRALGGRRTSRRIHNPAVKQRARGVTEHDMRRTSPHAARRKKQLRLPLFPATTIGSFSQTAEVRDRKSTRLNSSHRCISYAVF